MKYTNKLKRPVSLFMLTLAMGATVLFGAKLVTAADSPKPFAGIRISPATTTLELKNGEVYSGQMTIRNTSENKVTMTVEPASYVIKGDRYDRPDYNDPTKYSLMTNWIKVEKSKYDLEPESSAIVNYTINVPKDNVPGGMQYATLFAATEVGKAKTTGVQSSARAGMVISARMVDGKTKEDAKLEKINISKYQPESPMRTSFVVKNNGNIGASVQYQMTVKSALNGREVFKSPKQSYSVYPETSREFSPEWPQAKVGIYNVEQMVVINGKPTTKSSLVIAIPIWVVALLTIGAASLIAFIALNIGSPQASSKKSKTTSKKGRK